jgi:hypothetical protein
MLAPPISHKAFFVVPLVLLLAVNNLPHFSSGKKNLTNLGGQTVSEGEVGGSSNVLVEGLVFLPESRIVLGLDIGSLQLAQAVDQSLGHILTTVFTETRIQQMNVLL